jgi:hypothetical protein
MSPYVRSTESDIARGSVQKSATGNTATEWYSRRVRTIEHSIQTFDVPDVRLLYLKFVHETPPFIAATRDCEHLRTGPPELSCTAAPLWLHRSTDVANEKIQSNHFNISNFSMLTHKYHSLGRPQICILCQCESSRRQIYFPSLVLRRF